MTEDEKMLVAILELVEDINSRAILLQSYLQEKGPLSEEAGAAVRKLLKKKREPFPGEHTLALWDDEISDLISAQVHGETKV